VKVNYETGVDREMNCAKGLSSALGLAAAARLPEVDQNRNADCVIRGALGLGMISGNRVEAAQLGERTASHPFPEATSGLEPRSFDQRVATRSSNMQGFTGG
jgi:hypothetical protein